MELKSKQRAFLNSLAHSLEVVFQVGKGEIDDNLVKSTNDCLEKRELIKMKVLQNSMLSSREAAEELAEKTQAIVVGVKGSTFVLFKQKKKESKFDLKKMEMR